MKSLHRRAFTQRSFQTQKLLHKEVFTQSCFYTQKLLHAKAFTQRSLCTEAPLAAVVRDKLLAGAFGNSLAPQKSRLFPTKFLFHELSSKNIRNIFLKRCFGHFWTPKRWYLRSFLPVAAPNPCKLQHFLPLLYQFFALMNAKKRWYLRVFQKIEDRDVNETL